ncbi:hypothetical protein BC332_32948 [Capsicum chinense]|nr:hypothetical protein BC332_32948 [Capsicum chinense]
MTNESQMQNAATNVGATSIALTSRANSPQPMTPTEKPKKFTGIDFKRWQQKMFFYLTTLCLQRFTTVDAPEVPEGTSNKEHFMIVEAWKYSDFLGRNYILSVLQDDLYNIYSGTKTSKELWRALERKYKTEDAGIKKFFVARELLSSGIITVNYVKLKDNMLDPLTKGLSREGVERTSKGMGLRPRTSQHDVTLPSRLEIPRSRIERLEITYARAKWKPFQGEYFTMVSKSSFCFCFLNRKSSKSTKEEGSSHSKSSSQKSRAINMNSGADDGSHSQATTTTNSDANNAGAAAVAAMATSHIAGMDGGADGSSHGGGGGGVGGDGGGGGGE